MNRLRSRVVAMSLGFSAPALADPWIVDAGPGGSLELSAQIRPRFVAHSGRDFSGRRSEWREFVTQRSRFGAWLQHESGLTLALQLQDVRAWGEENGTLDTSAAGFDAHQAYGVIPFSDEFSAIVGRQEIAFGGQRLVGNFDWLQSGRSFDAARLRYESRRGLVVADAFYAKVSEAGAAPEAHVPEGRAGDVDFGGVHVSFEPVAAHEVAPQGFVYVNQAIELVRTTFGLYASGDSSGFSYTGEGYYQFARVGGESASSFLGAVRGGYTWPGSTRPGVLLWAEALTGDGTPASAFDTLFASDHEYYGELDLFASPASTAYLGLTDVGGRVHAEVEDLLRANVDVHYLRTHTATTRGNQELGIELDVRLSVMPSDYVEFTAFYGVLLPGDAVREIRQLPSGVQLSPETLIYGTVDVGF